MSSLLTPRDEILQKIRGALSVKKENVHGDYEDLPLYRDDDRPLEVIFAEALNAVGGSFMYCEDEIQLIESLIELTERERWTKIVVQDPSVRDLLAHYEFPFSPEGGLPDDIEVGVTACESLVARTGSVVISSASEGRLISVYPPTHVVIAHTTQLVLDIAEALEHIETKYGQEMPSMFSLITGPSRTSDIEKTLVMGAHGPKQLIVFLLEDNL